MSRRKIIITCLVITSILMISLLIIGIKAGILEKFITKESTSTIEEEMASTNPVKKGWTELMQAVTEGDLVKVNALLDKGVDINVKYNSDSTALMMAAYRGNLDIVKTLVNRGADINMQAMNGGTALSVAMLWGNMDVAQFFIDKGIKDNNAFFMAIKQVSMVV